ncbi:podocalyxin-like [Lacerta agilis]|uniref:podocalyxin-like n=1 Tax=Lacerta agilis TaxID=80427 RepID=UPI00141A136E|nr:podocalyxin-like [Lacerta agilis]
MQNHLKEKKELRRAAQPVPSFPPARQLSGYSSASFYDYTSLSPSTESTSSPGFQYNSSSETESTTTSDSTSPSRSGHGSASSASLLVIGSLEHPEPSAFRHISSLSERSLCFESGPSRSERDAASSPDHSSALEGWVDGSGSPSLAGNGDSPEIRPSGPPASPEEWSAPAMCSPECGPSKPPSGERHQGNTSGPASESESDPKGPIRLAAFSPHIMLKHLRGNCSCWQKRQTSSKEVAATCNNAFTDGKKDPSAH